MDTNLTELVSLTPINLDAGQVFSGNPSGRTVRGYSQACAFSPKLDNEYILHDASRDVIVWFLNEPEPLYVYGPLGSGKSSCIKQVAARLNYPVFEVTGHGRLEYGDLVGHFTVQNGNMTFEYGPLVLAMRYGGILLLNEIDLTAPEVAAGLNSILDGSPLCIAENGGEIISPNPMFRFVATANSNGAGDETGLYQGVQRQNAAFLDRFILCEMGYPEAQIEQKLIKSRFPVLPEDLCDKMVDYANEVRKLFMGEAVDTLANTIEVTFSTRSLLRWAALTVRYQPLARQGIQPIAYALDRALAYRASRETRAMLHELVQRIFPKQDDTLKNSAQFQTGNLTGSVGIQYLEQKMTGISLTDSPKVYLRRSHRAPNSYDFWQAEASEAGLEIHLGIEGTNGRDFFRDIQNCADQNPVKELLVRASNKLSEGYSLILEHSHLA